METSFTTSTLLSSVYCLISSLVSINLKENRAIALTHPDQFVVDGNWTTDRTAPQEDDGSNNINNLLLPENIRTSPSTAGIMSGVTPGSSTAAMAADVPKESQVGSANIQSSAPESSTAELAKNVPLEKEESGSSALPGAFPETPAVENQESTYGVNPLPATEGHGNPIQLAPGETVPSIGDVTADSIYTGVHDDPELVQADQEAKEKSGQDAEQTFGVAPIPATSGTGNPVKLEPGEEVPHHSNFTSNTVESTATTDQESYEKGQTIPPSEFKPTSEAEKAPETGMFGVPPVTNTMIPESSLPMGDSKELEKDAGPTIQSSGPQTTTAALAGQVPLEPRGEAHVANGVPDMVEESQKEAKFDPEASANPEAVREKSAMEEELEKKVPEEPSTSENGIGAGAAAAGAAGVAGGVGLAAATSYGSANRSVPPEVQRSIDQMNQGPSGPESTAPTGSEATPIAPVVPDTVQESIADSHLAPEATTNKEAVAEKSQVEEELLKTVKTEEGSGEPAPTIAAATAATAPAPTDSTTTGAPAASEVHAPVPPPKEDGLAAPAAAPAMTPATRLAEQERRPRKESRELSPMTKDPDAPVVTSGVGSANTSAQSTPNKPTRTDTIGSEATREKKKKNRLSGFFNKLKGKSDKK